MGSSANGPMRTWPPASAPGPRILPHRNSQAGVELGNAEWLREVVVGSGIQRGDLVALLVASGEDDDRRRSIAADVVDHDQATDAGEAEIEEDEVWPSLLPLAQRLLTIGGRTHPITSTAKVRRQRPPRRSVVLDQQDLGAVRPDHPEPSPVWVAAGTRIVTASPPSSLGAASSRSLHRLDQPAYDGKPEPDSRSGRAAAAAAAVEAVEQVWQELGLDAGTRVLHGDLDHRPRCPRPDADLIPANRASTALSSRFVSAWLRKVCIDAQRRQIVRQVDGDAARPHVH